MDTNNFIGISEARKKLPDIVDEISKYLTSYTITVSGKPKAVILSHEELDSILETAEILSIPGARESIKQGMKDIKRGKTVSFDEVLKRYGSPSKRKGKQTAQDPAKKRASKNQ